MTVQPGLVHTPVTPFTLDHRIDFDRLGTVIDFHLGNGADALALPMHQAESVSLSEDDKRAVLAFALDRVQGRVPVIALTTDAPRARPDFQLLSGTEHLVSAGAIGATGMFSSLAAIAPRLVRRLYDLCRSEKFFEARPVQEEIAALRQAVKGGGVASLKAALRAMGRDCGEPRPPLVALDTSARDRLAAELTALPALRAEPHGW